jgi:hypothetical protein
MAQEQDGYATFEGFLRLAIKGYWESRSGSKVNFLALLLASREAWQVAWGEARAAPGKVLKGAAGAAAVAVVLRTFLGGPIGILLTGASVASLVAVYVKNHERIWAQVARYRKQIERYRSSYEQVRGDYADGHIDREQRDLMIDGLMSRFLTELDTPETEHAEDPASAAARGNGVDDFHRHVQQQRSSGTQEQSPSPSERGDLSEEENES